VVAKSAYVRIDQGVPVQLAPGVVIGRGSIVLATTEMADPKQQTSLTIGSRTVFNEYCNLRASGGIVSIGANCIFAQFVSIIGSNHSVKIGENIMDQAWSSEKAGVCIGNDVWVGAGVTILPGATVDDGAVIAAGAVVKGAVGKNEIWGGIPARKLSERN
jgi:acetyltransferase-like isoleucine patch superfamily enzyme